MRQLQNVHLPNNNARFNGNPIQARQIKEWLCIARRDSTPFTVPDTVQASSRRARSPDFVPAFSDCTPCPQDVPGQTMNARPPHQTAI